MSFNRTIYKTKTSNKIKQTNNTATNILKEKKHAFHVDIRNIFDVATPTWQNNLRLDSQLSIQPNVQPNLMVMLQLSIQSNLQLNIQLNLQSNIQLNTRPSPSCE